MTMAKAQVYMVSKEQERINALGEQGWDIIFQNPLIIGKPFDMPLGAPIIPQFVEWLSKRINKTAKERKFLKESGFKIKRIYNDEIGDRVYVLDDLENSPLTKWRFEFDYNEDNPVAYITFGPLEMNVPAFAQKDTIDKYVPKEVLEAALASGSLRVEEIEIEEKDDGKQRN